MRARALAFIAFLLVSGSLFSQEKETIKYSNITECGFFATSPRSLGWEVTTVNGFSAHRQHCLGLGLGFGYILGFADDYFLLHTPVFINYRLYFKPDNSFSPHLNIAMGGTMVTDGGGFYSSVTMGFKSKKFSFSSGLSFLAVEREVERGNYHWGYWRTELIKEWIYPLGLTIKCGFTF